MTVQYLLMLIDRPVQICLDHPEIAKLLLLLPAESPHIDILLLQRTRTALHHLPVVLELLLRITDRIQIPYQDLLIILH